MSTKDLPEGRLASASDANAPTETPAPAAERSLPAGTLERPVPLLALPGFTLFPGTLVPLHAYEPEPCRTLAECLADRRLLVLAAFDEPGPERPFHRIAGLGRIVSDRRHGDGRIDAFVHGLARVALGAVALGTHGLLASVELVADAPRCASGHTSESGMRLFAIAAALRKALAGSRAEEAEAIASLVRSTEDLGLVTNRLAAAFVESFAERQALLEERCPATRADMLAARLGEALLAVSRPPGRRLH